MEYETIRHKVQFCVIGGGLAGMCAAISAARRGIRTLIMHERPMFGGNASSEVRMWICGARQPDSLESGLVEEFRLENLYRNTMANYSIWDSVLFEKVRFQDNLISLLNCSCFEADAKGSRIASIKGWQMTTQTFHVVEADYFADCSGDSILAPLVGAAYRVGREDKTEFNESLAQDEADRKTMGMSCILQARQTDRKQKFVPPSWAYYYEDDSALPNRNHTFTPMQNYWYLELGGDVDSIRDTENVRDELLKVAYGMWDHIKNRGDHNADNWELDWVGILPGKRESRRYEGDWMLSEKDVLSGGKFDDIIAYGGWPIDDHHPGGLNYRGVPNTNIVPEEPYGIPYRCIYSQNIGNLFFAGRNISCSHVALSSTRVMATCATLGQAVGNAVYCALRHGGITPREVGIKHIAELQQYLLEDDCFLLRIKREIPQICAEAELKGSGKNIEKLRNGIDRKYNGNDNAWFCKAGDFAEYKFNEPAEINSCRIVFDSDFDRMPHNMLANYFLDREEFAPPATLVKAFHIEADGKTILRVVNNYQRFVRLPLEVNASSIKLVIDEIYGNSQTRVFAFDVQ